MKELKQMMVKTRNTLLHILVIFAIYGFLLSGCGVEKTGNGEMIQSIAFHEPGSFAGWPANNGVWIWDDQEILVGLTTGPYEIQDGHNLGEPYTSLLSRSMDGGKTWVVFNPENFVGDGGELKDLEHPVNFLHPDLAVRVTGEGYHGSRFPEGGFFISLDRGQKWDGPYRFRGLDKIPELDSLELSPRTDYLICEDGSCLVFISARKPGVFGSDRVFCAETRDGGMNFKLISWVVPREDPYRAVMSSTVKCSENKLVSTIRRREIGTDNCWIDAYVSEDNGHSWSFLSKIGDAGPQNGNPPALLRLSDGRICCAYGQRESQQIIARLSNDEGKTWGENIVLRDDFWADEFDNSDLGYPRMVQRKDGRIVTIYYWATKTLKEQQIAVTIWDPDKLPVSIEESEDEPIKYVGSIQTDKQHLDGGLPHAVGVHHYQVTRANRTYPPEGGSVGWTYNHQPYLAHWNGKFYLQYLTGLFQEHTPPTRVMLTTSTDGRNWETPEVMFPVYDLPEIRTDDYTIPAGTKAVMHQRMGFYVAPNGKLLASGFYGYCVTPRTSPNAGNGLGRVIREINEDGTYGPVYFIRYNRHAGFNESNTSFPFYTESKDSQLVEACNELLKDKLMTLQWWEEDRAKDGFYVIDPGDVNNADFFSADIVTSKGAGKAFNFYHRPDGTVLGIWKNQYAAISSDEGHSWSPITVNPTLWTTGAKTWGQRTDDGKYVIVHNQSATMRNRFPMAALTGDDGQIFDKLLCLRGEIPTKRYQGIHKNPGAQYFRGIIEGNGNPPGEEFWITYSINKEDIWISSVTTPISSTVTDHVNDTFDDVLDISELKFWNLLVSQWAPVEIVNAGARGNALQLKDEEPYDYALAERIFPASEKVELEFDFNTRQVARGTIMEIEVQNQRGLRPIKLRIDEGWLAMDHMTVEAPSPLAIELDRWYRVRLEIDCIRGMYNIYVDQELVGMDITFAELTKQVERIVFRTGVYRGLVDPLYMENGLGRPGGYDSEDMPGSEEKAPTSIYLIDNVKTEEL